MRPILQSATVVVVLVSILGCARRPDGEYDPNLGGAPAMPFEPEVTEGAPGGVPGDPAAKDSDGDGVSDDDEVSLGLDPALADTDGDGFDDGVEVGANSDPLDAAHFPYTGGWAIDPCNTELVSSGNGVGQVTGDFALMDQHGEMVHLHDFCGREVLLVTSAMWCEPCQDEAPHLQQWYDTYADQGLMIITLLGQNNSNATPSQSDLATWANTYGLEHPVLADANWGVSNRWPSDFIPTMHLLGAGAVVIAGDTYVDETTLRSNLP